MDDKGRYSQVSEKRHLKKREYPTPLNVWTLAEMRHLKKKRKFAILKVFSTCGNPQLKKERKSVFSSRII
jgi:hypothetical protein